MNATEYDKNQKLKESTIPVSQYTGGGSQYAKPKLRASNSNVGKRNNEPIKRETKTQNVTDVPIYQLLKAFKLQQYTLKMQDLGYGHDVYKLALLSSAQRDDFIDQLKLQPGHKAKIAGFFSVIDEIYPRSLV